MTPREKAYQLCNKFYEGSALGKTQGEHLEEKGKAKQRALICVDEIELYRKQIEDEYDEDLYHAYGVEEYWQEVKEEIKKL